MAHPCLEAIDIALHAKGADRIKAAANGMIAADDNVWGDISQEADVELVEDQRVYLLYRNVRIDRAAARIPKGWTVMVDFSA